MKTFNLSSITKPANEMITKCFNCHNTRNISYIKNVKKFSFTDDKYTNNKTILFCGGTMLYYCDECYTESRMHLYSCSELVIDKIIVYVKNNDQCKLKKFIIAKGLKDVYQQF